MATPYNPDLGKIYIPEQGMNLSTPKTPAFSTPSLPTTAPIVMSKNLPTSTTTMAEYNAMNPTQKLNWEAEQIKKYGYVPEPGTVPEIKTAPAPATVAPVSKPNAQKTLQEKISETYMGQKPLDMAAEAGISKDEYLVGASQYPDLNPDALIGTLLANRAKYGKQVVTPPAVIPQPETGINQTTSEARTERDQNKQQATDLYDRMTGGATGGYIPYPTKPEDFETTQQAKDVIAAQQEAERLKRLADEGQWSPEQQAQINAAAESARLQYQKMVDDAEAAKLYEMPKAFVGAGQAGGFLSTQFMGLEALGPSATGKYEYTGGEVGKIHSEYQRALTYAQQAQQQAIYQAMEKTKDAIRTGKSDDLKAAQQAYQNAQTAYEKKITTAREYQSQIEDWYMKNQTLQKERYDYARQIFDDNTKDAQSKLQSVAGSGLDYSMIPQDTIDQIKDETGWSDFETKAYFLDKQGEAMKQNYSVQVKGNYMIMSGRNPLTGKLESTIEKIDGLPANADGKYTYKVDGNGTMWMIPDSPDPTKDVLSQALMVGKPGQFKSKPTGSGSRTGFPTGWDAETSKARAALRGGEAWGAVWNRMHERFPTVSNEELDLALGKVQDMGEGNVIDWSQRGAYEDWKARVTKKQSEADWASLQAAREQK